MDSTDDGGAAAAAAPDWLPRVTRPVSLAVLVLAIVSLVTNRHHLSGPALGLAIAALVVSIAGIAVIIWCGDRMSGAGRVAVMIAVGASGSVMGGLLPASAGFLIAYWALAGLGINLPVRQALAGGFVVFAALNLSLWLGGQLSIGNLVSQDIGAAFVFAVGAFTRSAGLAQEHARAEQARAEGLLEQLRASQAARAEAAALGERARLAREIHDVLAHALTGLILALDTMELLGQAGDTQPDARDRMLEQVRRAQRLARDGLADTKRAIAALRGDELPGPALLDRLMRDTAAATGIRAELTVVGTERPVPPEVGLTLYRTAQEALTNTAKYAGRQACVQLKLSYDPEAVELSVRDTGTAADAVPPSVVPRGGYGLTGMRERAELLGGSLTAGPTEHGFALTLRLPAAPVP